MEESIRRIAYRVHEILDSYGIYNTREGNWRAGEYIYKHLTSPDRSKEWWDREHDLSIFRSCI